MKTALQLTPQEWQTYNPIRPDVNIDVANLIKLEKQAKQVAKEIAIVLKAQFMARRVVLFGSLRHKGWFTAWSDIDLAVWGIAPDVFYRAAAVATGMSSRFKVDLVDIKDCKPSLQTVIEKEGVDL